MIDSKLADYIKAQLRLGKSEPEIRQQLIVSRNWSSSDIDETFNLIILNRSPLLKRYFFLICSILLIAGGVILAFTDKDLFIKTITQPEANQPTLTIPPNKLLILIEDNLSDGLQAEINQYKIDVKNELSWDVEIKNVSGSDDIFSLKLFVKDFYATNKLKGLLLIGNIPTGNMYHSQFDKDSVFNSQGYSLSDNIYQDLNNDCVYSVQKQAFDYRNIECSTSVTLQPFWVARLTPNSTTDSSLNQLKKYFDRNHKFRTGVTTFQNEHLAYIPIHTGTISDQNDIRKFKESFRGFGNYTDSQINFIDSAKDDSDQKYLSAIAEPNRYEAITFNGHGAPTSHQKNITPKDINAASFIFIDLLSCSIGRFTTPDYLAGKYLFSGGLITLSASVPIIAGSNFDKHLYALLSQGVPFYKAFEYNGIGVNILGDPTLKMRYINLYKSKANMELSSKEFSITNSGSMQYLTIKNNGDEPLLFDAKLKILKQKNSSFFRGSSFGQDNNIIKDVNMLNMILPGKTGTLTFEPKYFIDAQNIPSGKYEFRFLIVSNDPQQALVEIPVHYSKD